MRREFEEDLLWLETNKNDDFMEEPNYPAETKDIECLHISHCNQRM